MQAAIIHYWLVRQRGGENVLERILRALPSADLYTNIHSPDFNPGWLSGRNLKLTFTGRLPLAHKYYPLLMPLMPSALGILDMEPYDLVVSSEAGPAKWVVPRPDSTHICYMHSPLRYIWDQSPSYIAGWPNIMRPIYAAASETLRTSDVASSHRVDMFIANSSFVAQRIRKFYGRTARVIHPPVEVSMNYVERPTEDFYLCAGQLVPYKRIEDAILACLALNRRLVVVGAGPEEGRLRKLADGKVDFLGYVPKDELLSLFGKCRALLFPGVEDFGILPVEVMAAGRPVIAYARGGALDYVIDGLSGVLYPAPGPDALKTAIQRFERLESSLSGRSIHGHALRFGSDRFDEQFRAAMSDAREGAGR